MPPPVYLTPRPPQLPNRAEDDVSWGSGFYP